MNMRSEEKKSTCVTYMLVLFGILWVYHLDYTAIHHELCYTALLQLVLGIFRAVLFEANTLLRLCG